VFAYNKHLSVCHVTSSTTIHRHLLVAAEETCKRRDKIYKFYKFR